MPEPKARRIKSKPSENAKAVARDVLSLVGKGRKVVLGPIVKRHGYAKSIVKNPKKVTETQSFKDEVMPVVQGMESARNALITELNRKGRIKSFQKNRLADISTTLKNLTHDIQLLTGGDTEKDAGIASYIDGLNKLMNNLKPKK